MARSTYIYVVYQLGYEGIEEILGAFTVKYEAEDYVKRYLKNLELQEDRDSLHMCQFRYGEEVVKDIRVSEWLEEGN
jgi:hypothetical protein